MKKLLLTITILLVFLVSGAVSAETNHQSNLCQIPQSGPWPACATGPASQDACIIPPTGPWPACATGSSSAAPAPSAGSQSCVIPQSGPWPPCATGGSAAAASATACVIPPSGPWPACATGGGSASSSGGSAAPVTTAPPSAPAQMPTTPVVVAPAVEATLVTTDWSVDYFDNSSFLGEPQAQELLAAGVNGQLQKSWGNGAPFAGISADRFSARLQTTITAPDNEDGRVQTFNIVLRSDNPHTRLYVSTQSDYGGHAAHTMRATTSGKNTSNTLALCRGEQAQITIEYTDLEGGANVSFALEPRPNDSGKRCRVLAPGEVSTWQGNTGSMQVNRLSAWVNGYDVAPTWDVAGADVVNLSAGYGNFYDANANAVYNNAPASGTVVFSMGQILPFKPQLRVNATNALGGEIEQSIALSLTCRERWFYFAESAWSQLGIPGSCGEDVLSQSAAFQPFENGFMLWRSIDAERSAVFVFTADGDWAVYEDYEFADLGSVPPEYVAPIGLFSANGAIGRVWFYKDQLTDKLGWATEPATSYTTRVQASLTLSPHFEAIELPSGQVLFANRGVGAPEFDGAVNWRVVSP